MLAAPPKVPVEESDEDAPRGARRRRGTGGGAPASGPGTVIYLVRHGTSEWNLLKKWQGTVDTELAVEGTKQVSCI